MASKKYTRPTEISMWASVMTPARERYLSRVCERINNAGVATSRRQVGNIVNDLRMRGEFDIIDDLRLAVDAYNEDVRERQNDYDQIAGLAQYAARFKGVSKSYALAVARDCYWQADRDLAWAETLIREQIQFDLA